MNSWIDVPNNPRMAGEVLGCGYSFQRYWDKLRELYAQMITFDTDTTALAAQLGLSGANAPTNALLVKAKFAAAFAQMQDSAFQDFLSCLS